MREGTTHGEDDELERHCDRTGGIVPVVVAAVGGFSGEGDYSGGAAWRSGAMSACWDKLLRRRRLAPMEPEPGASQSAATDVP
jgi:hypothetical protein